MYKKNRGAMTNIRHICYDILGNILVYAVCHFIFIVVYGKKNISMPNSFLAMCLYMFIYILFCKDRKLYDNTTFYYPDRVVRNILLSCVFATTMVSTTFYLSGRAYGNRYYYILYFVLSAVELLLTAYMSFRTNHTRQKSMTTLLIGNKSSFEKFTGYIYKTNEPFSLAGYVKLEGNDCLDDWLDSYLGFVEDGDLPRILCENAIDQVYIMQESGYSWNVLKCIDTCLELGVVTRVVQPASRGNYASYISSVGTYPVTTYHIGSLNTLSKAFKRLMDVFGSLFGLIITFPILVMAAIAIKIESEGPVLFTQTRVGYNGRRFKILKLRTMAVDAEVRKNELLALNEVEGGYMFKIKEDPRITKVGAFLRKTSIDEIPQFFNVLMGDMSIVGTRPPTEDEVGRYEMNHWRRLRIKPGITGLWQISGRSSISSFDEVVQLDTQYIQDWSIFWDIRIILKTIAVVFNGRGAY